MSNMFCGCNNLINLNISNFNINNNTRIKQMFTGCPSKLETKIREKIINIDYSAFEEEENQDKDNCYHF